MPEKKSITFVSRSAPYGTHNAQLCLDMALACAVFDQEVNYVFLDDGVYQLQKEQSAEIINRKTLGKALETLALYDIENVMVDAESLRSRALQVADLVIPVTVITRAELSSLLQDTDMVFNL